MLLNGRWLRQIVDRDSGFTIFVKKLNKISLFLSKIEKKIISCFFVFYVISKIFRRFCGGCFVKNKFFNLFHVLYG